MEASERYKIVLDAIVCHETPGNGDPGPRLYNLYIRDRYSGATVNAYLVGSKSSVQAVVGRDEFLHFARLAGSADDIFGVLVVQALKDRGVEAVTPYLTFVKDLKPLLPPKPI